MGVPHVDALRRRRAGPAPRCAWRAATTRSRVDHCLVAHPALVELLPVAAVPGRRRGLAAGRRGDRRQRSAWWTPDERRRDGLARRCRAPGTDAVGRRALPASICGSARSRSSSRVPLPPSCSCDTVAPVAGDDLDRAATVVDAYGGVGLFAACAVAGRRSRRAGRGLAVGVRRRARQPRRSIGRRSSKRRSRTGSQRRPTSSSPTRHAAGSGQRPSSAWRRPARHAGAGQLRSGVAGPRREAAGEHYRLVDSVVLDLFPQTHHVEVVSRFDAASTATCAVSRYSSRR